MDIFHSAKLRVMNAKSHIHNLQAEIKFFFDTKPYTNVIEPDADGINQVHKIMFTQPIPDEFATLAADAVDNLRSVLDQAWYAIAIRTRAIQPRGEAYFPFADNAAKFDTMLRRGFNKFPQEIVGLVRAFQPYKGGNNLLWALNRICAANKHRMLAPTAFTVGNVIFPKGFVFKGPGTFGISWDREKQELIYAKVGPRGDLQINSEMYFSFDIAFDEVEIVKGQPAVTILRQLATIVERILMGLEAETRRLGYI